MKGVKSVKIVKIEKRSFDTSKSKRLASKLAVLERNYDKSIIYRVLKSLDEDDSFFTGVEDSDIFFNNIYIDKNAVSLIFSVDDVDRCITITSKGYVIFSLARDCKFSTTASSSNLLRLYCTSGIGRGHHSVKITDYLEVIEK